MSEESLVYWRMNLLANPRLSECGSSRQKNSRRRAPHNPK